MSIELIRKLYEDKIPFHKLLGLRVVDAAEGRGVLEFKFKNELVGNIRMGVLHGGVIASVLDIVGSLAVLSMFTVDRPPLALGTVDMRTDYLRPGRGSLFTASAEVVRPGQSVMVTKQELRNQSAELVAIGTATYRVQASSKADKSAIRRTVVDWLEG